MRVGREPGHLARRRRRGGADGQVGLGDATAILVRGPADGLGREDMDTDLVVRRFGVAIGGLLHRRRREETLEGERPLMGSDELLGFDDGLGADVDGSLAPDPRLAPSSPL